MRRFERLLWLLGGQVPWLAMVRSVINQTCVLLVFLNAPTFVRSSLRHAALSREARLHYLGRMFTTITPFSHSESGITAFTSEC